MIFNLNESVKPEAEVTVTVTLDALPVAVNKPFASIDTLVDVVVPKYDYSVALYVTVSALDSSLNNAVICNV